MNLWYGHPLTSVLLVDTPLPEGEWTNLQPYGGRGWCRMEQRASAMVKDFRCLISLSALTGDEQDWCNCPHSSFWAFLSPWHWPPTRWPVLRWGWERVGVIGVPAALT